MGHKDAYETALGMVRPGGVISRVGVPQYDEAPIGFDSLFGPNLTLTGAQGLWLAIGAGAGDTVKHAAAGAGIGFGVAGRVCAGGSRRRRPGGAGVRGGGHR